MTIPHPAFKARRGHSHISMLGYMSMLSRTRIKHATVAEICAAVDREKSHSLTGLVMWMLRLDMLRVHSWVSLSGKGKFVGRFAFGPGDSAEYPGKAGYQIGQNAIGRPPTSLIALQHMLDVLQAQATTSQVIDATGLSRGVVLRAIKHGRKIGLLRVGAYLRRVGTGGSPIPVYTLREPGEKDAEPPKAIGATAAGRNAIGRQHKARRRIIKRLADSPANNSRHLEAA